MIEPVTTPALNDPLWNKSEAASALGVSVRTVQTLRRQGKLTPTILAGKMLFRKSSCEACAKAAESGNPRGNAQTTPTDAIGNERVNVVEQADKATGDERFQR